MSELDQTLARRVGDEVARASDVIPPPLEDLERRVGRRRRRRWRGLAVGAAAAAAVLLVAVQLWPGASAPPLPAGAQEFTVPTYEWDGSSMEALVTGHLGFTPDGCTLIYQPGRPQSVQPVIFPDAVGVRFGNGVRAVVQEGSGRVYAVEGQSFEYGGGWVPARGAWTDRCGAWSGDLAWINDDPASAPLTSDPPPPEEPAPTRVATEEERGWFDVPTFEWDPAQGGDAALVEGTVTMTSDGCPVVVRQDEPAPTVGLILPNAQGMAQDDGAPFIVSTFPDGYEGVMAEEGMEISYGGGDVTDDPARQEEWDRLCPGSPVDALFLVQDKGF